MRLLCQSSGTDERRRLSNLKDCIHLHRHVVRQRADADGGRSVAPFLAENCHEQIGSAVDHLRVIEEIRRRIHVSTNPYTAYKAAEIASIAART